MVKNVFSKKNFVLHDALVIFGWLAFVVGVVNDSTWLRLLSLSIARVLP